MWRGQRRVDSIHVIARLFHRIGSKLNMCPTWPIGFLPLCPTWPICYWLTLVYCWVRVLPRGASFARAHCVSIPLTDCWISYEAGNMEARDQPCYRLWVSLHVTLFEKRHVWCFVFRITFYVYIPQSKGVHLLG